MARQLAATPLAEWLRAELDERGLGVRTLARKMNPGEPEIPRRMLNRILYEGSYPSEANRDLIAAALDTDPTEVPALMSAPFRGKAA
jgi:lambda repressor-like predicted transcriptional regulator